MNLEIRQLDLKYQSLRVIDKHRQARLMASLADVGQQTPVLVVASAMPQRFVLIDGYVRVSALRQLSEDLVEATMLAMVESEALILRYSLNRKSNCAPLEEALLIQSLIEDHGITQSEVAMKLGHSMSWVSRRLGLAGVVPRSAHELLREGAITAQATMKCILPLARAKPEHAEKLCDGLRGARLSTRQVARIYAAWRVGSWEQREKIATDPILCLKALEERERATVDEEDGSEPLSATLQGIARLCWRAKRLWRRWERTGGPFEVSTQVSRDWQAVRDAFDSLKQSVDGGKSA